MAWPKKVYAATWNLGVYLSEDFGGPSDPMPTWRAVNDGLGGATLRSFWLDLFSGGAVQYGVDDTDTHVWQRTDDAWSVILSVSDARTLTGEALGTCLSVASDPVTGYLYVLFVHFAYPGSVPYMLRSIDRGASWTSTVIDLPDVVRYRTYWAATWPRHPVDVYNGVVTFTGNHVNPSLYVYVSEDHGLTWTAYTVGSQGMYLCARVWPGGGGWCFSGGWDTDLRTYRYGTAPSVPAGADALDLYPYLAGSFWFDKADPQHMIVRHNPARSGDYTYFETRDGWASVVDATPPVVDSTMRANHYLLAPDTDDGQYVIGHSYVIASSTSGVPVAVTTDLETMTPRSGPNVSVAPYVDSIPNISGGLIDMGLWGVGVQPGRWGLYECVFVQEVA